MSTFTLTGVKPQGYKPDKFMEVILEFVTQNVQQANAFRVAVEQGQTRYIQANQQQRPIIATELDFAGVIWTVSPP